MRRKKLRKVEHITNRELAQLLRELRSYIIERQWRDPSEAPRWVVDYAQELLDECDRRGVQLHLF